MAECMCSACSSASVVPTSKLEAGDDISAPDVELGVLAAAEELKEYSDDDSDKHPDKLVTAIT